MTYLIVGENKDSLCIRHDNCKPQCRGREQTWDFLCICQDNCKAQYRARGKRGEFLRIPSCFLMTMPGYPAPDMRRSAELQKNEQNGRTIKVRPPCKRYFYQIRYCT